MFGLVPDALILASTSPRRKALLEQLGLTFTVEAPDYEEVMDPTFTSIELAELLALGKARAVASLHTNAVVVAADTFVAVNGHLLGKPQSAAEATDMLERLSAETHSVFTGFAVVNADSEEWHVETVESKVTFRALSPAEIMTYIATGEPLDKAGAYGLQGMGGAFVEKIEGDVGAIIGLPLAPLCLALREFGIPVIDTL